MNEVECVDGFEPNDSLDTHIYMVGYFSYFTQYKYYKGGVGDNLNLPEALVNEALNDIEELSSTNECYWKQGREVTNKNPNSHIVS